MKNEEGKMKNEEGKMKNEEGKGEAFKNRQIAEYNSEQ